LRGLAELGVDEYLSCGSNSFRDVSLSWIDGPDGKYENCSPTEKLTWVLDLLVIVWKGVDVGGGHIG